MNCCVLLAAATVSCPWTVRVVRTCQEAPVVQTLPAQPAEPTNSPIVEPVTAQEIEEVAAEELIDEEEIEDAEEEAVLENASDEDSVLEPAGLFGSPGLGLDHLALDWGVATIGPGTLHPTLGYVGGSVGGLFGPTGAGQTVGGFAGYPCVPTCCHGSCEPGGSGTDLPPTIVPPPPEPNDPEPEPVPEPHSMLIWGAAGALILRRRLRKT